MESMSDLIVRRATADDIPVLARLTDSAPVTFPDWHLSVLLPSLERPPATSSAPTSVDA
jgi:hypothetical protein